MNPAREIAIDPPRAVLDIAERLERAGYETWCVGGAVRDALLGRASLDWDLTTAATPDAVRTVFGARRTIPIGVQHGTVGVLDRDGRMHEVTTFRRDVETDGRHAVVEFGGSIDADLGRRDFTINAIAYRPRTGRVCDPFGGRDDLNRCQVRAVGEASHRMQEDRLRALRALRFAGRLGFTIAEPTWRAVIESAPFLTKLSPERVKQEIEKTLEQVERPAATFRLWRQSGAFAAVVPSLAGVTDEQLGSLDWLPRPHPGGRPFRKILRLAALFGAATGGTTAAMSALRFSRADIATVERIVRRAAAVRPAVEQAVGSRIDDVQIRRWVAAAGRLDAGLVMRLLLAWWSADPGPAARQACSAAPWIHRRMLRSAFGDPVELSDLAIDGDDLRRGGIPPGPPLGKILHQLLEQVLEDPSRNTPGTLLATARELYGAARSTGPGASRGSSPDVS